MALFGVCLLPPLRPVRLRRTARSANGSFPRRSPRRTAFSRGRTVAADHFQPQDVRERRWPATRETAFSLDVTKQRDRELRSRLRCELPRTCKPVGGATERGFDNPGRERQIQVLPERRARIDPVGGRRLGHRRQRRRSASAPNRSARSRRRFSSARGFGDLSQEAKYLRPLALTGQLGIGLPTRASTTTIGGDGEVSVERTSAYARNGDSPSNTAFRTCSRSSGCRAFARRSTG